jgi:CRP-like cAMP-binding protein
VLLLRQNALLARASVSQLLHVAGITRVVPLSVGTVLFTPSDQPALYHLVEGEVRLDADGSDSILAGPGSAIGVAETLAGVPVGRRATVTRAGRALRLDHEELFDVLGDHIDLLQSLFSGLLTRSQSDAGREAGLADDTSGIAV